MNTTTIGIDLAKNVFILHGVDGYGKVALKKTASRVGEMGSPISQPMSIGRV